MEMNGTCTLEGQWSPAPQEHNCTLVKGIVTLTLLSRNTSQSDIVCPGDTLSYNCNIQSNSEYIHLMWHATLPGSMPVNITYDSNSVLNTPSPLIMNTSVYLNNFTDSYIESTSVITIPKRFSLNGTKLECSIESLGSDMVTVFINTSVPNQPSHFDIIKEYHTVSNVTVTFKWSPPQGYGPEVIVDGYKIIITPAPLSHPTSNIITALIWNVTLEFNVIYNATIISINCAGFGSPYSLHNIIFLDCGIPLPPTNGNIVRYSGTKVGDYVIYKCNDGFRPSNEMLGTCSMDSSWLPVPNCNLIKANISLLLLERNELSTLIDCPGDTITYNCSVLSNSEMVHLTWHITFPGLAPINITYDSSSLINAMDYLGLNVSATLLRYIADQYIESVIKFTLLKNVTMNGTLLECSVSPSLDNDTTFVFVNTSVPFSPINFNITSKFHGVSNVTVTFQWDPPQGSGPAVVVDTYEVIIMPRSLSHPILNVLNTLSLNVTLNFNLEYTASITAENCAGVSEPLTLQNIKFLDCGIPIPPINGSIVNYSDTKLGNIVTFKCGDGFRPSAEVIGTCGSDTRWNPAPEKHNCTLIKANVSLLLLERNEMSTLINCPGDTITYNCSVLSNSEMVHLTWHITFPGLAPITITYDNSSLINVVDYLGLNVSATLLRYIPDQYIESVIKFTLLKNVTMNGTLLECSVSPSLDNDTTFVLVNTSVPFSPINFNITSKFHGVSNVTVTFQWDPPQGSGPAVVVDTYEVIIMPRSLSHPILNVLNTLSLNVTLNFNLEYTASITAENCAGVSEPLTLQIIKFLDCGIPIPPINGSIVNYSDTKLGNIVTFKCGDGFRPSAEVIGTCGSDTRWNPAPEKHNCTLIKANVSLLLLERNEMSTLINCPGDTITYNCSVLSNSEMVHLTWHITFPGLAPITITYDNSSLINVVDYLGLNVSATLLRYIPDQYIESVIKFTLLKNVTMNGTLLECSVSPSLDNDTTFVLVNTSVPFSPINFNITSKFHGVSNVTVTFQWDPPQGSGPAVVVDTYEVIIMPRSLSHPILNVLNTLSLNVTLNFNLEYTASITAENCAGVSEPLTLQIIKFLDCGIPIPPINGSIVNYSDTKLGNIVTFKCGDGFRPSAEVIGTCGSDTRWNPAPEKHNCTLIKVIANVSLLLLERNEMSTLIDCPGDTITYNCSVLSNSEMVHLTWHIAFPGLAPINITYDNSSLINAMDYLGLNVSATLLRYIPDQYIESVIKFTLLKNVTMNGTLLECSVSPSLDNDTTFVLVNTSVPFSPINFNITSKFHGVSNVTVTFQWDPPQGSGPAVVVDTYEVTIMPRSLSHPISSVLNTLSLNVTLNYNVEYNATITAQNCAGVSEPLTLQNIKFLNCGIPIPPINGSIVNYSGTKLLVTFKCDEGFRPSAEVVGTCGSDTRWNPAPSEHNCTFIKASITLSLLEQNEISPDIDCSGDTIIYNCSILSNSESLHLTWSINLPGLEPFNITYTATSTLRHMGKLDFNISSILTEFRLDEYIESQITLTLLKNVTMNGTELTCSTGPDYVSMMHLLVNTSVPLMPTGFNTSMQYDSSLDTVVTFQWDPPQGSGPEAIVNSYKISITPRPISHPAFNTISYSTSWNVTLYFNLEYSASITAVNCAGDSHPFTLHGIKFIDCYAPAAPMDGHILNYSGTKIGDFVIFNCSREFRPSHNMRGNCTKEGRWYPAPAKHNCTALVADVDLTIHDQKTQRSDINCPGDIISFNCSIESNSETVELTWKITLPDEVMTPISITYNSNSLLNRRDYLDIHISTTLMKFREDEYIESLIFFNMSENVHINGTELQCSSSDLDNAVVDVLVNMSVPLSPTGFSIIKEYYSQSSNITVTFDWDSPSGTGPEAIVDRYSISISPNPLSHPGLNSINSPPWNVTLLYNRRYVAIITAENCAGKSPPFNIEYIINCGIPAPPVSGSLSNYSGSSGIGATVNFQCDQGYTPSAVMNATCMNSSNGIGSGVWKPKPHEHNCTLVRASAKLRLIERNKTFDDIDCPGDTVVYRCLIESNSENLHLTWSIHFSGLMPINITYNETSVLHKVIRHNDIGVSTVLTNYTYQNTIASEMVFTLSRNASMGGDTIVMCSIAPNLASSAMSLTVNTSAPLSATNFEVKESYTAASNIITLGWDPPHGSGPEAIIHYYKIVITPEPLSHPNPIIVYATSWNVTVEFNVQYSVTLITVNCEGESNPLALNTYIFGIEPERNSGGINIRTNVLIAIAILICIVSIAAVMSAFCSYMFYRHDKPRRDRLHRPKKHLIIVENKDQSKEGDSGLQFRLPDRYGSAFSQRTQISLSSIKPSSGYTTHTEDNLSPIEEHNIIV